MAHYAEAAEYYDLLYRSRKDYAAEVRQLAWVIRTRNPDARRVLDVGCGTGAHARALLDAGFDVDGVDLEPAFVEIAARKCPEGRFRVADMLLLDAEERYDVVTCLFSAIGYVRTVDGLREAVRRMACLLAPGGMLLVDPWFEPGQLTPGWINTLVGEEDGLSVCRMSRTVVDGRVSHLEFEYLIGRSEGIERRSERHELGLFTQAEMEEAFERAGLAVERRPDSLRTRGLYVGWHA
ncbi:MAG: class I SAM-dependent methyltransferase [Longimicrobiales bacterium]